MPAASQPVQDLSLSFEEPQQVESDPSNSGTLSRSASYSASASMPATSTAREAQFPSKTTSRSASRTCTKAALESHSANQSTAQSSNQAQLRSKSAVLSSSQAQLSSQSASQSAAPSASWPASPSESSSHPFPILPYVPGKTVDIVVLSDPAYAVGVAAIINAARLHTKLPVRVFVGFDGDPLTLRAYLECLGMSTENVTVRRSVPLVGVADLPKAVKGRER